MKKQYICSALIGLLATFPQLSAAKSPSPEADAVDVAATACIKFFAGGLSPYRSFPGLEDISNGQYRQETEHATTIVDAREIECLISVPTLAFDYQSHLELAQNVMETNGAVDLFETDVDRITSGLQGEIDGATYRFGFQMQDGGTLFVLKGPK